MDEARLKRLEEETTTHPGTIHRGDAQALISEVRRLQRLAELFRGASQVPASTFGVGGSDGMEPIYLIEAWRYRAAIAAE